ncbi:MAG: sulfite exporter TauE/SafE family protein [Calditerrivibrio sp.]|uniref:sulfite exporter TauE/SafE family protein n=1 Tax=Calditerrivibrio sp. TaxID=2792612 RepID=UPI003D0D7577
MEIILLVAIGIIAGFLGALLGIGGGSIIVPILVTFLHYPMHTAVAIGLLTIVATSVSVVHVNILKGLVNLELSLILEFLTVIASIVGGFIGNKLDNNTLQIIFGIILSIISLIYIKESIRPKIESNIIKDKNSFFYDEYYDFDLKKYVGYSPINIIKTMIVSIMAGTFSGMLGIGGGILKVPAMNLLSKIPIKVAIATSNYMIGITAASGSIPYIIHGKISPAASIYMIVGVIFGSKVALIKFNKIKDKKLKILFGLFLIFVSLNMLYKGLMR